LSKAAASITASVINGIRVLSWSRCIEKVPLGHWHQILDARLVRRACEELGLDPAQLPGPKSRV